MPKDGSKTRLRILEETTELIYRNGFSGTTIDRILEKTSITKGAFFYHFRNKAELALQLIQHFSENDIKMLKDAKSHALKTSDDPKEQLLAFVDWYINYFNELNRPDAGCLYASFVYEPDQFDEEIKDVVTTSILEWRKEIALMINAAIGDSRKFSKTEVDSIADMFSVLIEGAFVTAKALKDPKLTARQLRHYRQYLEFIL